MGLMTTLVPLRRQAFTPPTVRPAVDGVRDHRHMLRRGSSAG
jgi:hypothetical protein